MSEYILTYEDGYVLHLTGGLPSNLLESLDANSDIGTLICISGINPTQYKNGDWYGINKRKMGDK